MSNCTKEEIEQLLKQSEIIETLERKVVDLENNLEDHIEDYLHEHRRDY